MYTIHSVTVGFISYYENEFLMNIAVDIALNVT